MSSRELVALARDLVAVPSHDGEAAAGDFLEEWLREHTDAEVTRDEAGADEGRGGNVLARKGDGDPTLALVGHHDVVPPADVQTDEAGYVVTEADGRLYGRGTADMKGAVAAMLLAFREADPAGELVFASFVGEETGGTGSRHAIQNGFAPDLAVVGEGSTGYSAPGVTDVAVAHRGRRASTVVARGEAAHAGEPDAGANAVYRAYEAVEVLRSLDAPEAYVPGADDTLAGSVTATMVEGGSAWNVVPDRCEVTVDERTVPGEGQGGDDGGTVGADLARVEDVEGVEWRVDQDWPPMHCTDEAFVEGVLRAARAVQGADPDDAGLDSATLRQRGGPQPVLKPHATDAGWLSAAGVECVVCGPAEPGEAHTDDESVSVDVLQRCREIYRRVAETPRWP